MQITEVWVQQRFPELNNIVRFRPGGFKEVFAPEHPTDGHVVLKIIQPSQTVESVEREILAAQHVASPRVPRIYQTGQTDTEIGPCFWFREQRVIGSSVRDCLKQGPLGTQSLLRLGLHTLEALVKAEEANIVHRDVKPDNIMQDQNDDFWLLDFGIARHLRLDPQTATSDRFGKCTPGYAPAEQFRNMRDEIDARSDLFALGVTLHECATGSNPFYTGARNEFEVLKKVETLPLPPMKLTFAGADNFQELVKAMTQKIYYHRPDTAREALVWMQEVYSQANP